MRPLFCPGAPPVLRIDPRRPDRRTVIVAADVLREGGVALFPTDTLYGLGCSSESLRGADRLREIKGGDRTSPFILLIGEQSWAHAVTASVPDLARRLMRRYWPGPLTIVLDAAGDLRRDLVSGDGTVALRLPGSPWCTRLCIELGAPVVSTSANRFGMPPVSGAAEAVREFGSELDLAVDGGPPPERAPSTLVDARGSEPIVLREGVVKLSADGLR